MSAVPASLRDLQVALHRDLLGEATGIGAHVVDDARLPAARRLQVYRHAYASRLQEALRETFEKTHAYVGDDAFDALAAAFVRGHPSRHRNLRWFGAGFSAWLMRALPRDPDVGELARLEWALRRAFDARDDAPGRTLGGVELAGVAWTSAGCRFTASLRVVALRSNAAAIWHALDRGESPPPVAARDELAQLMVWRHQGRARFRTLEAGEHAWLLALRGGRPLAAVCGDMRAIDGAAQAAATAVALVLRWCEEGVVVALADRCDGPRAR